MKLLFTFALLLSFTVYSSAQDLIYRDSKTIIKCKIDTSSLNSDMISYTRYDQEGKFQVSKSKILYIKSFNGDILYPKNVIGVEESKHLHWPNATHLLKDKRTIAFSSIQAGINAGYTLCTACFDNSTPLPDRQIEKLLTEQALFDVRINLEVLNGDKRLEHLNAVLKKVLDNWPEKKKGYDYRIQIYKGDLNAFSVPGGYIFISSLLLDLLESDYELESVLTHEIVHIEKRHSLREWSFRQSQKETGTFLGLFFAVIANIVGEGKYSSTIISLVNNITDLVIDLRKNGYSRDLEEEADILALHYFQKQNIPIVYMKTAYAKIADYYWIRGSDLRYSSGTHPNSISRINQIEKFEATLFSTPIVIECKEKLIIDKSQIMEKEKEHSFIVEIMSMNNMPSSTENNLMQVSLLGNINNENNENTYKIKSITLTSVSYDLNLSLEGCDNMILPQFTSKEYFLKTTLDVSKVQTLKSLLDKKDKFNINIEVERVNITPKGNEKNYNYNKVLIETKLK